MCHSLTTSQSLRFLLVYAARREEVLNSQRIRPNRLGGFSKKRPAGSQGTHTEELRVRHSSRTYILPVPTLGGRSSKHV